MAQSRSRFLRFSLALIGAATLGACGGGGDPPPTGPGGGPPSGTVTTAIPAGGGVVTIATSGHPYEGLTLTVPSGTFASTVHWALRERTDLTLPSLPSGYRVGGPLLEVTTDAPRGGALMTLDVPIPRPAGEGLVLAFYDPARRIMEVLPTVAQTDASTRVVTTHLRADLLLGRQLAGLLAPPGSGGSSTGVLVPIVFSLPQPAVPSVTSDRWPVVDYGSVAFPAGFGAAIPAIQTVAAATNAGTNNIVKPLSTPGFYADAGILGAVQDAANSPGIDAPGLAALAAQYSGTPKPQRDDLVFQNLTASLALTKKPTLAVLFPISNGPVPSSAVYANPVGSGANGITAAMPTQGSDGVLGKGPAGFQAMAAKVFGDGPSTTVDAAMPLPSFVFDFAKPTSAEQIIDQYDGLSLTQKIALNEQLIKSFDMKHKLSMQIVRGGASTPVDTGTTQAMRQDFLKFRVDSGGGKLDVYDAVTGQLVASDDGSGVDVSGLPGPEGAAPRDLIFSTSSIVPGAPTDRQGTPFNVSLDRVPFRANPDTAHITANDMDVNFDAPVFYPPSVGFKITWDWGDGDSDIEWNSTTATHRYAVAGDYTVKVTLYSADDWVELAQGFTYVRTDSSPHWRLTSMQNADTLDLNVPIPIAQLLQQAITSPGSAMISVDLAAPRLAGVPDLVLLRLRINLTGSWTTSNCCGPVPALGASHPNELWAELGSRKPSLQPGFGTRFTDYEDDYWKESTSDLGAGTMEGQHPTGRYTYEFRPPDPATQPPIIQTGPEYVLRISAARRGTAMSGTITFYYWPRQDPIPGESAAYYDEFPDSYSFPFTAVRIK
jgi:hypothetical protein